MDSRRLRIKFFNKKIILSRLPVTINENVCFTQLSVLTSRNNNDSNKTNIYTGYTLQQVKTAVINVCPVPYALM